MKTVGEFAAAMEAAESDMSELLDGFEKLRNKGFSAAHADALRSAQRNAMLVAREAADIACRLYGAIREAEVKS
jgi:hypothetical protein